MRFEGIHRTCRAVRRAAVLHGWVVVHETRAGTDRSKARAEQQAPRNSYLVARGDGRLLPVDINWLEALGDKVL